MSLALYRKYRPATFAEVVGQDHVTEPLRTALAAGRINHAYLFSGPRGCGKTSSARILARSLNCENGPTPDPCGTCSSCVALAPEGSGSLDVVELDAASHGGVDEARALRDRAFYLPAESRYRVFIIDEAHMVTKDGFNALLKIVEEPPEHLVFIFATTEPEKVLPTIRSRTHHYPFHLLPPTVLRGLLEKLCGEEGVAVEPAVFPLVVRAGAGSARDALSVLDQLLAGAGDAGVRYSDAVALLGVTDAALLDEMVEALEANDGSGVFGAIDKVVSGGHDPRRFGADLLQRLRDLVILQAVPDAADKGIIDVPDDELATMSSQAQRLPIATLTRYAEILHEGLSSMRGTTSPRLVLELLSARMLLPEATLSDGGLLQRLERLERRIEISGPVSSHQEYDGDSRGATARLADESVRPGVAPARSAEVSANANNQPSPVPQPTATQSPAAQSAPEVPSGLGLPAPPVLSSDRPAADPSSAVPRTETTAEARPATPGETSASQAATAADPVPSESASADPPATDPRPADASRAEPESADAASPTSHTEPAPPQPSAAATTSELSAVDVRRLWREVLDSIQSKRRSTQILLEAATVADVSSSTLLLWMPSEGLARQVMEARNVDVLRVALGEVLGVDWRIRCEVGDASTAMPSTTIGTDDPHGASVSPGGGGAVGPGSAARSTASAGSSDGDSSSSSAGMSAATAPGAQPYQQQHTASSDTAGGRAADYSRDTASNPDRLPHSAQSDDAELDNSEGADLDRDAVTDEDASFDPTERAEQLLAEKLGARRIEQSERG